MDPFIPNKCLDDTPSATPSIDTAYATDPFETLHSQPRPRSNLKLETAFQNPDGDMSASITSTVFPTSTSRDRADTTASLRLAPGELGDWHAMGDTAVELRRAKSGAGGTRLMDKMRSKDGRRVVSDETRSSEGIVPRAASQEKPKPQPAVALGGWDAEPVGIWGSKKSPSEGRRKEERREEAANVAGVGSMGRFKSVFKSFIRPAHHTNSGIKA